MANNYFVVAANRAWFIVEAANEKKAKAEGVKEWGTGFIHEVRKATADEVRYYKSVKGQVDRAL